MQPLLANLDAIPEQNIVAALINDLASTAAGWLVVLDDYHAITDFAVHDLLALLVEQQPPGFHIVIGTREDPPLPLARLRARGQMTEVRERSLRFQHDEAAAFLNETMKLTLSAASITALEDRTEGWAAGLQLAALALLEEAGSGRTEAFITTFSGDDRYIMDYLMTEVLQRQPADIRTFLHQTAILDRLTAPLCDAVLDSSDEATRGQGDGPQFPPGRSQEILEYLDRVNLFIIPLDHRREWYRYHRLFAEFLRASMDPSQQLPFHKRAAAWYEQNGFPQEAVRHQQATSTTIRSSQTPLAQSLVEPLSEREIEVLVLIAAGLKNREIGRELYITTGTVKRHTNHIYGKLGVHSRTAAVARARELGLL
jgi:LuxR family maltose regulon positive regulatory protein